MCKFPSAASLRGLKIEWIERMKNVDPSIFYIVDF